MSKSFYGDDLLDTDPYVDDEFFEWLHMQDTYDPEASNPEDFRDQWLEETAASRYEDEIRETEDSLRGCR